MILQDIWTVPARRGRDIHQPKPNLGILRVCQQTHVEAHAAFWRTNTFCFRAGYEVEGFLDDLGSKGVGRLKRILMTISPFSYYTKDVVNGWSLTLFEEKIARLADLDLLHVVLRWDVRRSFEDEKKFLEKNMCDSQRQIIREVPSTAYKVIKIDHENIGMGMEGLFELLPIRQITQKSQ